MKPIYILNAGSKIGSRIIATSHCYQILHVPMFLHITQKPPIIVITFMLSQSYPNKKRGQCNCIVTKCVKITQNQLRKSKMIFNHLSYLFHDGFRDVVDPLSVEPEAVDPVCTIRNKMVEKETITRNIRKRKLLMKTEFDMLKGWTEKRSSSGEELNMKIFAIFVLFI